MINDVLNFLSWFVFVCVRMCVFPFLFFNAKLLGVSLAHMTNVALVSLDNKMCFSRQSCCPSKGQLFGHSQWGCSFAPAPRKGEEEAKEDTTRCHRVFLFLPVGLVQESREQDHGLLCLLQSGFYLNSATEYLK